MKTNGGEYQNGEESRRSEMSKNDGRAGECEGGGGTEGGERIPKNRKCWLNGSKPTKVKKERKKKKKNR